MRVSNTLDLNQSGRFVRPDLGQICFYHMDASGSEITPCNKIDKPPVVYRFSGNVMTSITTLRT